MKGPAFELLELAFTEAAGSVALSWLRKRRAQEAPTAAQVLAKHGGSLAGKKAGRLNRKRRKAASLSSQFGGYLGREP